MNISLIDKDTQQFLKGVKKDWNHLLSRSKTNENLVRDLKESQDGVLKSLNTMKLNMNSNSDYALGTTSPKQEVIEEEPLVVEQMDSIMISDKKRS